MNTLILYATKYGGIRYIVQRIADGMGGAKLHNLGQGGIPALDGFDCVIIGSSIYIGSIRKEAKAFLSQHAGSLRGKRLGLFLSGMEPENGGQYLEKNFTADLLSEAKAASFLGGSIDPAKLGVIDRFLIKIAGKTVSEPTNNISDEKIAQFVEVMRS
ncbi:MAG: flavodoxin domain-containing protein [Defluviitaleaceae bacterium]|nr:flavodoxin domain-containing protein [Defluviitaleaceae bacterium]